MDLEHLNKSQIVLLTLLVSFVTSIATGIVTVALMEQAPPTIAQTVNRVVERTVEKVVPSGETAGAATVTEKTIIVQESDLIAQAVSAAAPAVVRLYTTGKDALGETRELFLGFGVVIREDGTILTDSATLPVDGVVSVALSPEMRVNARLIGSDAKTGLALLAGATSTKDGAISWRKVSMSGSAPALGKVVVALSGRDATRIGNGIVTALSGGEKADSLAILETNVPVGAVAFGSALINTDGEVVGLSTVISRLRSENSFLASSEIMRYTASTTASTAIEETVTP